MDQELKQRLIGAAVITALAAIFVPMLFDDPIDETGKTINELKMPEVPAKAQDVEIMPLPEKSEDVATATAIEQPQQPEAEARSAAMANAEEDEAGLEAPKPKVKLGAKDTAVASSLAQTSERADMDVAEAEDFAPARPEVKAPTAKPVAIATAIPNLVKPALKPAVKPLETIAEPSKPAVSATGAETATNRWYLNAGSFSQKSNAQTLLDTLKQQGFAATIKDVAGDKGTVYKVRVGPMLDKAKAQAVKSKLAQINIPTFVSGEE